ncbi:hypothetical protein LCGC14_2284050, partial [marine sediment metagenome]
VQINKLGSGKVTTLARLEPFNPSGSIKNRILDDTEKLNFSTYDETINAQSAIITNDALTLGWHFVVVTYAGFTGTGNPTDFVKLYVDSSLVNTTAIVNQAGYVSMRDLTTKVVISGDFNSGGTVVFQFADKIDNVVLFDVELGQGSITTLYNSGNGTEDMTATVILSTANDSVMRGWHFFGVSYSAPATEATAADGIILYVDGVAIAITATTESGYVSMENNAGNIDIGRAQDDAVGDFLRWADKIDNVAVFSDVLTATEATSDLFTADAAFEVETPYLTADLPTLKFEQSADVMFITHPDYEPRKLLRTGDTDWELQVVGLKTGPFRDQNTDTAKTIVASATTGSVTLTAVGHAPFALGTTAGHSPSGALTTSKSQTGALFKLVQAVSGTSQSIGETLNSTTADAVTTVLAVPKGVTWDWTTNGTWGTGGPSTLVLERSYDAFTTKETVATVTGLANKNIVTSGTEDFADATYRTRVLDGSGTGNVSIQFSIRDTSHIGIVEITSVASSTVATGTVRTTLASTDKTHRFSEGSFSNRRSWPIDVTISAEERLSFAGNVSEPLTTWGSVIGDFTDFKFGSNADDA